MLIEVSCWGKLLPAMGVIRMWLQPLQPPSGSQPTGSPPEEFHTWKLPDGKTSLNPRSSAQHGERCVGHLPVSVAPKHLFTPKQRASRATKTFILTNNWLQSRRNQLSFRVREGGMGWWKEILQFVDKKRGKAESSFLTQRRAAVKKRGGHKRFQKGLLHLHTGRKFETGQKERSRDLCFFLPIKMKDWKTPIIF